MAFTEAQLNTVMDPTGTGRTVTINRFMVDAVNVDMNLEGVTAPYAGKSIWVQIPNTNTAAQAWTLIQAALK